MPTKETCRLCGKNEHLQKSHIIPNFVITHQRKTSPTGFFRSGVAVNHRTQDGEKMKLLCRSCEELFSQWETSFAQHIYHPCNKGTQNLPYDSWMLKFAVSVSWRSLMWYMDSSSKNVTYTPEADALITDALNTWKQFLLGEIQTPLVYEQHMLILDPIKSTAHIDDLPPIFNRFLVRGTFTNLATFEEEPQFIFTKMGRVVLLGFIGNKHPARYQWDGTKLYATKGCVRVNPPVPRAFINYLIKNAKHLQSGYDKLSPKQQKLIGESFDKNLDRVAESEYFEVWKKDVEMFGRDNVFPKNDGPAP